MTRKRRTMLYIPGNNPAMIQQGGVYGADAVLLDLEDAVALNQKDSARDLVSEMLKTVDFYGAEKTVRVNHLSTPFGRADLEAIVPVQPDAIRLPKIDTREEVLEIISIIEEIENKYGLPHNKMTIHPMIETAIGVQNAYLIASAHPRIDAITIGGQDLTADMGIASTPDNAGIDYARKAVVMAAKACRIDALDTVFADVDDDQGLKVETTYAKKLGFTGKAIINPRQVFVVHDVFSPTEEEIRKAVRIVREFEKNKADGIGVFAIDGKMIDAPVVTRAKHVLDLANIDVNNL